MSRAEEVQRAIQAISDLHELGRKAHTGEPDDEGSRPGRNPTAKKNLGKGRSLKARQFFEQYRTQKSLEKLLKSIRETQSAQGEGEPVFGVSHIYLLVTIADRKRRAAILEQVLMEAWSTDRMETEINKQFGPRREGGRKRRIAEDKGTFYSDTEKMCESWRRWAEVLGEEAGTGKHVRLADLPKYIRERINAAVGAVDELHEAVFNELRKAQRAYRGRPHLEGDDASAKLGDIWG